MKNVMWTCLWTAGRILMKSKGFCYINPKRGLCTAASISKKCRVVCKKFSSLHLSICDVRGWSDGWNYFRYCYHPVVRRQAVPTDGRRGTPWSKHSLLANVTLFSLIWTIHFQTSSSPPLTHWSCPPPCAPSVARLFLLLSSCLLPCLPSSPSPRWSCAQRATRWASGRVHTAHGSGMDERRCSVRTRHAKRGSVSGGAAQQRRAGSSPL